MRADRQSVASAHLRGVTPAVERAVAVRGPLAAIVLFGLLVSVELPPVAVPQARAAPPIAAAEAGSLPEDCFEELERGRGAEIACLFPLRLSDTEQAELEKGSRGYVKNVTCTMTIRVARAEVEAAIAARDLVFQAPEQPVACTVTTHKSSFDITGTFAPRVVFKDDVAVEGSPGLGNIEGVSRVISWPVVQFVNRWPSIRKGLLQVVNAYRVHARRKAVEQ